MRRRQGHPAPHQGYCKNLRPAQAANCDKTLNPQRPRSFTSFSRVSRGRWRCHDVVIAVHSDGCTLSEATQIIHIALPSKKQVPESPSPFSIENDQMGVGACAARQGRAGWAHRVGISCAVAMRWRRSCSSGFRGILVHLASTRHCSSHSSSPICPCRMDRHAL